MDPNELLNKTATRIDPATGARSGVYPTAPAQIPQAAVQPNLTQVQARVADVVSEPVRTAGNVRAQIGQIQAGPNAETVGRINAGRPPNFTMEGAPAGSPPGTPPSSAPRATGVPGAQVGATPAPAGARRPGAISTFARGVVQSPEAQMLGKVGRVVGGMGAAANTVRAMADPTISTPEKALRVGVAGTMLIPGFGIPATIANLGLVAADTIPIGGQTLTEKVRGFLRGTPPAPVGDGTATPRPTGNALVDQIPGYQGANSPQPTTPPAPPAPAAKTPTAADAKAPYGPAPTPRPVAGRGPISSAVNAAAPAPTPQPAAPVSSRATHYDPTKPYDPNDSTTWAPVHAIVGKKAFTEAYDPNTGVYQPQDNVAPLTEDQLNDPAAVLGKAQELSFQGRVDEAKSLMALLGIQTTGATDKDVANIQGLTQRDVAGIQGATSRAVESMRGANQIASVKEAGAQQRLTQSEAPVPITEQRDWQGNVSKTIGYRTPSGQVIGGEADKPILPSAAYRALVAATAKKLRISEDQAAPLVGQLYKQGE